MRIQHNIAALNSYSKLNTNNSAVQKNLEKLSSGYRINRAADDAAGLGISEKMRAQITGLETAQKNAKDGISVVQTAEGALTEVHSMLNRMVELATQSANGIYTTSERNKMQAEANALMSEIDRIANNTNFNGTELLNGSLGGTANANGTIGKMTLQIGDTAKQSIAVTISAMTTDALLTNFTQDEQKQIVAEASLTTGTTSFSAIKTDSATGKQFLSITSVGAAQQSAAIAKVMIERVSDTRGKLGAVQNRLDHTLNNLSATTENLTESESRIRDTDMANEMMGYTKNNILVQSAQAMLAQANQIPQGVLQLLQ